jgi:hypothetical protein
MPLEKANALQDAKAKDVGGSFDTAASLIRMHFPDLQPELEKCETGLSRAQNMKPTVKYPEFTDYDDIQIKLKWKAVPKTRAALKQIFNRNFDK